jgi:replicative DNA helicase
MAEIENEIVANVQNEILFVGVLYKKPDLYIEFERFIKSKYYFTDPVCKFLYDEGFKIYKNRSQNFNETTINLYMSEDQERFMEYKKFGGYRTIEEWMDLAIIEDCKSYFEVLQKYALIREYERRGFNTDRIRRNVKFESMNPKQLYYNIKKIVDDVHTRISGDPEMETLNSNVTEMVNSYLEKPAMGEITPFWSFNELFRGLRTGTAMCTGMVSNAGKTRFMIKLIAYLAFVRKQKCLVMLNEMSVEDIRLALLVTVLNNKEFQKYTGVNIEKPEREVALGIYYNEKGDEIKRETDEITGDFEESLENYIERLKTESKEYNDICKVSQWIEDQLSNTIHVVDICMNYRDEDLEAFIRKGLETRGIRYFFYDTLKNDLQSLGEWAALKQTTTRLAELAKSLNIFFYGSIQLTDDTNMLDPLDLNSMQIAASKGLKTVLTTLTLWKEIDKKHYKKYTYISTAGSNWGEAREIDLPEDDDPNIKLYSCVVDKNRAGAKSRMVFRLNLNLNKWEELGYIYKR